jgi:hypothetical protein
MRGSICLWLGILRLSSIFELGERYVEGHNNI